MIERLVQRAGDGAIERILERTLTPLEEPVERLWPKVRHGLRQKDIAHLEEVQVELLNIPPTVDPRDVADAICSKIIREPDGFSHTTWRTIVFTVTPTKGAPA